MAKRRLMHINLNKLADKLFEHPPADGEIRDAILRGHESLFEHLRKQRLDLTDAEFRQRYATWLRLR